MLVIDNALPMHIVRSAVAAWPKNDWSGWHRYKGATADKYGSLHASLIPEACRFALQQLALRVGPHVGESFIDYDLHAAGLHQIPPGGFLGRHLDAEFHPLKAWQRTHSIVMFLDDFRPEDGGELVIEPFEVIQPVANRVVIFETPGVWHEVLPTSRVAQMRRTLALFAWREAIGHGNTSARFEDARKSIHCSADCCGNRAVTSRGNA